MLSPAYLQITPVACCAIVTPLLNLFLHRPLLKLVLTEILLSPEWFLINVPFPFRPVGYSR